MHAFPTWSGHGIPSSPDSAAELHAAPCVSVDVLNPHDELLQSCMMTLVSQWTLTGLHPYLPQHGILFVQVAELESLMALQGVHVALPSKVSGEAALLHGSVLGNGQDTGNGHIAGPKMKAAAASYIPPTSDDKVRCSGPPSVLHPSWHGHLPCSSTLLDGCTRRLALTV